MHIPFLRPLLGSILKGVKDQATSDQISGKTNSDARHYWQRKKGWLRFCLSLLFVSYNVLGLEFASPNYRLTEQILEQLLRTGSIRNLLTGFLKLTDLEYFVSKVEDPYSLSHLILIVVIIIFTFVVFYVVNNDDPFSHTKFLLQINSKLDNQGGSLNILRRIAYSKYVPWNKEISFYAKYLPCNRLQEICGGCRTYNSCRIMSRIEVNQKIDIWGIFFHMLDYESASTLYRITHNCRKAYFLKYGFLMSAISLIAGYLFARFIELRAGLGINLNPLLLLFIIAAFIFFLIFWFTNPVSEEKRGVWGKFKQQSDHFISFNKLPDLLNKICDTGKDKKARRKKKK